MKKIVLSLFVAGFMLFGLRADAQTRPAGNMLDKYKWKKRPLLIFAPSADDAVYIRQKEAIQAKQAALTDRDMVVVEVIGEDAVYVDGKLQQGQHGGGLRSRFQVPPEAFAVVLVGKDGTEKSRNREAVALENIFDLIDQMPMRRQEMRGKDN